MKRSAAALAKDDAKLRVESSATVSRPRSRSVCGGSSGGMSTSGVTDPVLLSLQRYKDEKERSSNEAQHEIEIVIDEVQRSLTPFMSPSQSLRRMQSASPFPPPPPPPPPMPPVVDLRAGVPDAVDGKRRGWSVATRATAMSWARRAVTMKYLHLIVSQWYDKISRYLSAPVAFLLAGVGTGMVGVAAGDSNTTVSYVFMWILAGVTFIAAGLSAANWELDPSKLSERHLQKSVYWSSVADDIMLELSLSATEQHDAKWFFPYVQRNMSLTENLPPVLPTWVFRMAPSDVLHGALSRDLMDLDRRFGTICGVLAASSASGSSDVHAVHISEPESQTDELMNVFSEEIEELQQLRNNLSSEELMMIHRRVKDQVKLELNERNLETMFGAGGHERVHRVAAAAAVASAAGV